MTPFIWRKMRYNPCWAASMLRNITACVVLAAAVAGCSKQPAATPLPSQPSKYTAQTSQGDRRLVFLLDTRGLAEREVLQVVESVGLSNNLISRGVGGSKIGGSETHFFALDRDAIDSAVVLVGFRDLTNAVIEAVYKGTNDVYFDGLCAGLRSAIERHFKDRTIANR